MISVAGLLEILTLVPLQILILFIYILSRIEMKYLEYHWAVNERVIQGVGQKHASIS